MILGLQLIAIIFALIMVYFALLNYKRSEINKIELLSWLIIWAFTIFIVIFPEPLRAFAKSFLITRLFDLMVVGGFILVISMVVRAYMGVKRMEKRVEDYVRQEALRDVKKKDKK